MMKRIERVTKGLEVCREMDNPPGWRCTGCTECPYHGNGCAKQLKVDALELLEKQQKSIEQLTNQCNYKQIVINEMKEEQPPKKGHWEKSEYASDKWHQCSECGTITERVDKNGYKLTCNFCRICGADMRDGQKRRIHGVREGDS